MSHFLSSHFVIELLQLQFRCVKKISETPNLDMSVPATSFKDFDYLPKELRLLIWKYALPGPRIIPLNAISLTPRTTRRGRHQYGAKYPLATYFSSPSPNNSITSLVQACKDSYALVKQHYSLIFPRSSAWIDFSIEFLYLDWGYGSFRMTYSPEDFTSSWPEDCLSNRYGHAEFNVDVVRQVKNLVIYENAWMATRFKASNGEWVEPSKEGWVVRDLLRIFPSVKVLVFADQLHSRDEAEEELMWLSGELGEEVVEDYFSRQCALRSNILWRG